MTVAAINSNTFAEILHRPSSSGIHTIENATMENFEIPADRLDSIHFSNVLWNTIDARGITFKNLVFENCTLRDSDLSGIISEKTTFKNCTLLNVVFACARFNELEFENCQLINDPHHDDAFNYREMVAKTIIIFRSDLKNIDFSQSKMHLTLKESTLDHLHGLNLKEGSRLEIENSSATDLDFSGSRLSVLIIKNCRIQNSKINHASIDRINLENNDLKLIFGSGSFGTIVAKNSNNIIIGKSTVKNIALTSCSHAYIIHLGDVQFDTILVDGCSPVEFIAHRSTGRRFHITNSTFNNADISGMKIDEFGIENVTINKKLNYQNTHVMNLVSSTVSSDKNTTILSEGANFVLKTSS